MGVVSYEQWIGLDSYFYSCGNSEYYIINGEYFLRMTKSAKTDIAVFSYKV